MPKYSLSKPVKISSIGLTKNAEKVVAMINERGSKQDSDINRGQSGSIPTNLAPLYSGIYAPQTLL